MVTMIGLLSAFVHTGIWVAEINTYKKMFWIVFSSGASIAVDIFFVGVKFVLAISPQTICMLHLL